MSTMSIPAFHVSDNSKVSGAGDVFIQSRKDVGTSGIFNVRIAVQFNPAVDLYPTGTVNIKTDLTDSAKGNFKSTTVELINSYGKHNPTAYLTGRCDDDILPDAKGCRYWVMIANNKQANQPGTADVVGFAIHDSNGNRIAYGTGPVSNGDFTVDPR